MTVVPNRPVDGNRRPKVRNTGAQTSTGDSHRTAAIELPPVLFRLPNLRSNSGESALPSQSEASLKSAASEATAQGSTFRIDSGDSVHGDSVHDEGENSDVKAPAIAPVSVERRSIISRLMTNALLLGVIGLAATWVYVVAKNVRSAGTAQVADANAPADTAISSGSTTSIEDMVANAERLALNQSGDRPAVTSPIVEIVQPEARKELPSPTELMAEATAAVEEAQDTLKVTEAATTETVPVESIEREVPNTVARTDAPSIANASVSLNAPNVMSQSHLDSKPSELVDFNATMPAPVTANQTSATPVSARTASTQDTAEPRITVPPAQDVTTDPVPASDTPLLPAASRAASSTQPVMTSTPGALTPPLNGDIDAVLTEMAADSPVEKNATQEPRRFSKAPSGVTDWLKYLPPAPNQ